MTTPTGYTDLGLVGFTDRGSYNASATYVKNDLVNYKNIIWKCIKDDTTGIEPSSTDTANWVSWLRGQVDTGTGPITTTEWSTTLSDNNWKQISDASRLGKASELWNIGDPIYTPILTGSHVALLMVSRIAGFSHDDLAYEEGKAGITFVTAYATYPATAMSVTQANGGYLESNIYSGLSDIERCLQQGLRDVLKTVKKKVFVKGTDSAPTEFNTKLFTPALVEFTAATSVSYAPSNFVLEGETYELFDTVPGTDITGVAKTAYMAGAGGAPYGQATAVIGQTLRTGMTNGSYASVSTNGSIGNIAYNSASNSSRFMFCV